MASIQVDIHGIVLNLHSGTAELIDPFQGTNRAMCRPGQHRSLQPLSLTGEALILQVAQSQALQHDTAKW